MSDWSFIGHSELGVPVGVNCAAPSVKIDGRLLERAFQERAKKEPNKPESWNLNLSVWLFRSKTGDIIESAWNDPKLGKPISMHSENHLMNRLVELKNIDSTTTVEQVFSERVPCGPESNDCRTVLQGYGISASRIFYLVSGHQDRGYIIALAYFKPLRRLSTTGRRRSAA